MNQNKLDKLNTLKTYLKEPIFSSTDIYVRRLLICIANWSAVDLFPWQAIYSSRYLWFEPSLMFTHYLIVDSPDGPISYPSMKKVRAHRRCSILSPLWLASIWGCGTSSWSLLKQPRALKTRKMIEINFKNIGWLQFQVL